MITKRSSRSGSMESNYIPSSGLSMRSETKGTLLVREPTTVPEIFLTVLLFACRKYLFFPTHKRLFVYAILLVASVVGDFVRFPKIYFADSGTFLNRYLVKFGWFWTLLWTMSFLTATSRVFCLRSPATALKHVARLAVATFFWYFWTGAFDRVDAYYGRCSARGLTRSACKSAGHQWKSFDISGHVFILVYSTLVMISEARPIVGWDAVDDALRKEENARMEGKRVATAFGCLDDDELRRLKAVYKQMTPYARGLFVAITVFVAVWELMLITTMMYFHIMPEKLLAGLVAMSTWFVTYRLWYASSFFPPLPGEGFFKYQALQKTEVGI